jgi:hypothetical protein
MHNKMNVHRVMFETISNLPMKLFILRKTNLLFYTLLAYFRTLEPDSTKLKVAYQFEDISMQNKGNLLTLHIEYTMDSHNQTTTATTVPNSQFIPMIHNIQFTQTIPNSKTLKQETKEKLENQFSYLRFRRE